MRIRDKGVKNTILGILGDRNCLAIISRLAEPMSVQQISDEFNIPLSSAYRYISILKEAGLINVKSSVVKETGAKYSLYESILKGISISFEGGSIEMDMVPNKDMAGKFMGLWRRLGEA